MLEIKQSQLCESNGVFSDTPLPEGEVVGIWASKSTVGRKLFQKSMKEPWYESQVLGRYANHSLTPNTEVFLENDNLFLRSKGIKIDEEITVDYTVLKDLIGYEPNLDF